MPIQNKEPGERDTVTIGIDGLLASTEKLLAVNRGLEEQDERDSIQFKRIHQKHDHIRERIELDADKSRLNLLRRLSKTRSLKNLQPNVLDGYSNGLIIGNQLSSPLEEINPIQIQDDTRRVTQMGPGGLGSTESITEAAQSVHPSQLGYLSVIEGPESEKIGIDTRLAEGVMIGDDGNLYQKFRNKKTGDFHWLAPKDLANKRIKFPD